MLPRENRLKQKSDFERVKRKGTLFNKGPVGLAVYKRGDSKATRVGIVVSLKVSKKAVERNKVKRMIRECVRKRLKTLRNGFDVVILTKTSIIDKDSRALDMTIENLFEKAELRVK